MNPKLYSYCALLGVEHNLRAADACEIALFLHPVESPSSLTTLEISKVNLTNEGVAKHLSLHIKNLTDCNLQSLGLKSIACSLQNNIYLKVFNLGGNIIGNDVATEIVILLSKTLKFSDYM